MADRTEQWKIENKKRLKINRKTYAKLHPDKIREWRRSNRLAARKRIRNKAIKLYGGICSCCKESNIGFLTFDHINGRTKEEVEKYKRNRGRSTYKFSKDLLNNPIDLNIRVLCFNCNCGRNANDGNCPHNGIKILNISSNTSKNESLQLRRIKRRKRLKYEALKLYGCVCVCCDEKIPEFLTFDHINGITKDDAIKYRFGKNHSTLAFYQHVIANRPNDIRILCFNCNCARDINDGICPHHSS